MGNGNLLTIGSIFYSVLLIIIFFSNKRIKSFDNKIYSMLIICNFIGLIIAVACYYTVYNYEEMQMLNFKILFIVCSIVDFYLFLLFVSYNIYRQSKNR